MGNVKEAQEIIKDVASGKSHAKAGYLIAVSDIEKALTDEGYVLCKVDEVKELLESESYTDSRGMKVLSVAYVSRLIDQACE